MRFRPWERTEASRVYLDAVAQALRLTDEERGHLVRLAQSARSSMPQAETQQLRPSVRNLLNALGVPALVER